MNPNRHSAVVIQSKAQSQGEGGNSVRVMMELRRKGSVETMYSPYTQSRLSFLRRRVRTRRVVRQWLLAGGALVAGALATTTMAVVVFDVDIGAGATAGAGYGRFEPLSLHPAVTAYTGDVEGVGPY